MTWGEVWAEDDYRALLRRGSIQRDLDEAEHGEWRAAIRRRARADRLRIRTGGFPPPSPMVWAALADWQVTDEERREALGRLSAFTAEQRRLGRRLLTSASRTLDAMTDAELQRETQIRATRILEASPHPFRMREEAASAVAWCEGSDERLELLALVLARFYVYVANAALRSSYDVAVLSDHCGVNGDELARLSALSSIKPMTFSQLLDVHDRAFRLFDDPPAGPSHELGA